MASPPCDQSVERIIKAVARFRPWLTQVQGANRTIGRGRTDMVSVSIGPPDPQITQAFVALTRRAAGGNVFMHPVALAAAAATSFAQIHVLSAWHDGELVGFWALRERRFALLPAFLSALPYHYAFLSNPVIDPAHLERDAGVAAGDRRRAAPAEGDPAQAARRRRAGLCGADGGARCAAAVLKLSERARPVPGRPVGAQAFRRHGEEAAAGLESPVRARRGRDRECARHRLRVRRVRDLPRSGTTRLEGGEWHRAAVRRRRTPRSRAG